MNTLAFLRAGELGVGVQPERQTGLRSTVKGAALSLVVARPGTAYDVAQRYTQRFGSISACSERNVRTILKRLEDEQLIERREPSASGGSVGASLCATAAGVAAHRAWLAAPIDLGGGVLVGVVEPSVPRRDILVRVLAATPGDRDIIAMLLGAYEEALLLMVDQGTRVVVDGLAGALIREERELMIQAQLHWVESAREQLLDGTNDGGAPGS